MNTASKYYLIGIFGTAMASLAGMLQERGYVVEGSDSDVYPPMSDFLERLGIRVYNGYRAENLAASKPDIVVIGNAPTALFHLLELSPQAQVFMGAVGNLSSLYDTMNAIAVL